MDLDVILDTMNKLLKIEKAGRVQLQGHPPTLKANDMPLIASAGHLKQGQAAFRNRCVEQAVQMIDIVLNCLVVGVPKSQASEAWRHRVQQECHAGCPR